ncbi:MAG: hypothetical protein ABI760_05260 [Ferruginibacter sp.]
MEAVRKRILRIHGTVALVTGTALATLSTMGALSGTGIFTFLQQDKLVHAGLLQAYLLFALIGFVLIMVSRQENVRKWNRVGAAAHALVLIAYGMYWNLFATIENGMLMRTGGIAFHSIFLSIEIWAGFISKRD